jgi:hypothetical protein
MRRLLMLGLLTAALAPDLANAQTPTRRIRGTVQALEGSTLVVQSREGETLRINLSSPPAVVAVVPATLADAKPGAFIGTAAVGPKDRLRALEVLIFPEAMRGTGEGHFPWDLMPESTMTNATIESESAGTDGRNLVLVAKGEKLTVAVPADAPVVTFGPGDAVMLQPGAKVFIGAQASADGTLSAARVAVGKDGLMPPM